MYCVACKPQEEKIIPTIIKSRKHGNLILYPMTKGATSYEATSQEESALSKFIKINIEIRTTYVAQNMNHTAI